MKHQDLFSLKDKRKKIKCHLLQILYGALRVKLYDRHTKYIAYLFYHSNICSYKLVQVHSMC